MFGTLFQLAIISVETFYHLSDFLIVPLLLAVFGVFAGNKVSKCGAEVRVRAFQKKASCPF